MTLGQQKLGFLIDNEADSVTYYSKTPEYMVRMSKLSCFPEQTFACVFPVVSEQTRS